MPLYTPFLSQIGQNIGQGLQKKAEQELIQSAYMGDQQALAKLSGMNPQAAQQIRSQQIAKEQSTLQNQRYDENKAFDEQKYATGQVQYAEKTNIAAEDRKLKAQTDLQEIKTDVQKNIANFDTFEQAKPYYDQQISANQDLINIAGVDPKNLEFTPDTFKQIKQAFGGASKKFEGKAMDAQVNNLLIKGVENPAFRKTPEYALAYQEATKPTIIRTPTGDIALPPNLNVMFKAPNEKDKTEKEQIKELKDDAKESVNKINYIAGTQRPEKFTEGEKLSAGFYGLMKNAESEIGALGDFDPSDPKEVALGLSNITASEKMQLYTQASSAWIRAKLRKESGAVIADSEMAAEYRTFFPRLGDTLAVINQKKDARKLAEEAMKANSGTFIKEAALPQGVTEEDISVTMRNNNMTRQQVLDRLWGG